MNPYSYSTGVVLFRFTLNSGESACLYYGVEGCQIAGSETIDPTNTWLELASNMAPSASIRIIHVPRTPSSMACILYEYFLPWYRICSPLSRITGTSYNSRMHRRCQVRIRIAVIFSSSAESRTLWLRSRRPRSHR